MNFCRRCGKLLEHSANHVYRCSNGHTIYANHSPAAGIFFVSDDNSKVLLTTRGIAPNKGAFGIPGGFLDTKETFEEGAIREVREEIGLEATDYGPLVYLTSEHDTYIYQNEEIPVVTILFWARLQDNTKAQPKGEVDSLSWHPLDSIDLAKIGSQDIRTGILALQKVMLHNQLNKEYENV